MSDVLLNVQDLRISIPTTHGLVHAVNGISYEVMRGEIMGIIGESGSGKSVSSYAVMHLVTGILPEHLLFLRIRKRCFQISRKVSLEEELSWRLENGSISFADAIA